MPRRVVTPKGKQVQIEGLVDLQNQLSQLANIVADPRAVKYIHMRAAIVLRDEARRRAPILDKEYGKHVSGLLRRGIIVTYGKPNKTDVAVTVNYKIAPHAHLIEYGTGPRILMKTGKSSGRLIAQPFMRPALTAVRAQCVAIIAQGFRELIEKTVAENS